MAKRGTSTAGANGGRADGPDVAHLRRLVDNLGLVVFELDTRGTFVVALGRGLEILGLRAHVLVGQKITEFGLDSVELVDGFHHALGGAACQVTATFAGRHFDCQLGPLVDDDGRIVGVSGVLLDASEHVAAEEAIRRSEQSFRSLIESGPDAVIVHRFGRIVFVNGAVVSLLGYDSAADVLGRPYLDLFGADHRAAAIDQIRASARGESLSLQTRMLRRGNELVPFELTSIPLVFDGEPATVAIARDISERLSMQRQLHQTERLASLGTLAGGVGHEINNPLASMIANLSFVAEELAEMLPADASKANADVHEALADVRDGADRVREIVKQLGEFTRVDDDVSRPVDLSEVIDQAVRMSWNQLRRHGRVRVHCRSAGTVEANPARLGQVFLNLLLNASQALSDRRDGEVEVACDVDGESLVASVSDNGPGIPEDVVGSIFDPFFSTKPVGQGTGLGLSVAHGIVVAIGGSITVRAGVRAGTTFRVELPLHQAAPQSPTAASEAAPVLVVEDELKSLSAVQRALRGRPMILTGSGATALEVLESEPVAAVLFDVAVADMSPARMAAAAGDTPTIAFGSEKRDRKNVPGTLLGKPIDADELRHALDALGLD